MILQTSLQKKSLKEEKTSTVSVHWCTLLIYSLLLQDKLLHSWNLQCFQLKELIFKNYWIEPQYKAFNTHTLFFIILKLCLTARVTI